MIRNSPMFNNTHGTMLNMINSKLVRFDVVKCWYKYILFAPYLDEIICTNMLLFFLF